MKKVIVYFHDLNSGVDCDHVKQLEAANLGDVVVLPIDYHQPDVTMAAFRRALTMKVLTILATGAMDLDVIFVGSGFGAWWASIFSDMFQGGNVVLINPVVDPVMSLKERGFNLKDRYNYRMINFQAQDTIFIGNLNRDHNYSEADFSRATLSYTDNEIQDTINHIKALKEATHMAKVMEIEPDEDDIDPNINMKDFMDNILAKFDSKKSIH